MSTFDIGFATRVSRFALLAILSACGASPASPPETSLAGSAACMNLTCGSGELCVEQASGIPDDAGVGGISASCTAVAAGCDVTDCDGSACPTCVAELCADYPGLNDPDLQGRILSCPGE